MSIKNDVADEIKALEKSNGALLPEDVVESARDASSPLHNHFTWDDGEAAVKHRLNEARTLIRTVKMSVIIRDVPMSICAYVRDPESDAHVAGYRNVTVVRNDKDLSRAALVDEMTRVGNAVVRAKKLAFIFGAEESIEQIDALAKSVTNRITIEPPEGPQ